jgi:hypothetical protein
MITTYPNNVGHARFTGMYRALVADNMDPLQKGSIRVTCNRIFGDQISPWAIPGGLAFGPNQGFFFVPPVGQCVWLYFEDGLPHQPVWQGGWWPNGQPPAESREQYPNTVVLKTSNEHAIIFNNTDAISKVSYITGAGHSTVMDDIHQTITTTTIAGNVLTMNDITEHIKLQSVAGFELLLNDASRLATLFSPGGHQLLLNDAIQKLEMLSAGGHSVLLNDAGRILTILTTGGHQLNMSDASQFVNILSAGGHSATLSDINQAITLLSAGNLKTVMSDVTSEISHIAPNIGLGHLVAIMDATNAAINNNHLTTMANNINGLRLNDLLKLCNAMIAAGVPSAGGVYALIASLTGITVPNGSSIVKIAS